MSYRLTILAIVVTPILLGVSYWHSLAGPRNPVIGAIATLAAATPAILAIGYLIKGKPRLALINALISDSAGAAAIILRLITWRLMSSV